MNNFNLALGAGVALGFLFGILGHEVATHRAAAALGDQTGRMMRRMGFSIKSQADPVGTYIMPAIFVIAAVFSGGVFQPSFGWGKRHSITPSRLRNPRRDMVLVSLSGPATTAALAIIAGVAFRATRCTGTVAEIAGGFIVVNVFLTVIELLPMPGRDGGRLLQLALSPSAALKFEELVQYEILFLLGIFIVFRGIVPHMAAPILRALLGHACASL